MSCTGHGLSRESAWSAYLERLEDAELARVFEYQSLDGGSYRNNVEDILTVPFLAIRLRAEVPR
jgi:hypothetical protein